MFEGPTPKRKLSHPLEDLELPHSLRYLSFEHVGSENVVTTQRARIVTKRTAISKPTSKRRVAAEVKERIVNDDK